MKVTSVLLICTSTLLHVSSSQTVDCPSEGVAYIPHSRCTKFQICVDGVATEMTCPFNLFYNPETSLCDFTENVVECRGVTRPPITTTPRPPQMTKCGQTMTADNGNIQYKQNEPYDAGELSVFMIKFKTGYLNSTFTLEASGISDSDPDAITIFRIYMGLGLVGQLGKNQEDLRLVGYGAVIIFRTNSSSGTGFIVSFRRDGIQRQGVLPGFYAVFDEMTSHLDIPFSSNYTGGTFHNLIFFTAGHKMISEPNTFLNLTTTGVFRNENNSCFNMFSIYSFENYLRSEKMICWNRDDYQEFKFSTRGLFYVYQQQVAHLPTTTGYFRWEKRSTA